MVITEKYVIEVGKFMNFEEGPEFCENRVSLLISENPKNMICTKTKKVYYFTILVVRRKRGNIEDFVDKVSLLICMKK